MVERRTRVTSMHPHPLVLTLHDAIVSLIVCDVTSLHWQAQTHVVKASRHNYRTAICRPRLISTLRSRHTCFLKFLASTKTLRNVSITSLHVSYRSLCALFFRSLFEGQYRAFGSLRVIRLCCCLLFVFYCPSFLCVCAKLDIGTAYMPFISQ